MLISVKTPSTIGERVERAANSASVSASGKSFQNLGANSGLVMGTPGFAATTVLLAAVTASQYSTAFFGGAADREFPLDHSMEATDSTLDDLIHLYDV